MRPTHCDVCDKPLCVRGPATTGVCMTCRMAGAAFLRAWLADLCTQHTTREVAAIAGISADTVRVRLGERKVVA